MRRADLSPEKREQARSYDRKRYPRKGRGWGKGYCKRCAGLAHRVPVGERCEKCGLQHEAEAEVRA